MGCLRYTLHIVVVSAHTDTLKSMLWVVVLCKAGRETKNDSVEWVGGRVDPERPSA